MALTIYDIAKEAGVSITTVSRALNDSYSISEKTKQHVLDIAERLNYQPSTRARNLAMNTSGTVIFATDLYRNAAFDNPHMFEILNGITRSLEEKHYAVVLKHIEKSTATAYVRELMQGRLADGMIIHAEVLTRELAAFLSRGDTAPYLILGRPDFPCNVCWMDVNHELAGHAAASYLLDKGYRRVLYVAGTEGESISSARLRGIQQAMQEEELQFEILYGDGLYTENVAELNKRLSSDVRPEVILCVNNRVALDCLQCIRQMNLRIPQDIALMTFDNYPFSHLLTPRLTAVEVDMFDMGWEAARFLLRRIKKPQLQTQSFCTVPKVIEREST